MASYQKIPGSLQSRIEALVMKNPRVTSVYIAQKIKTDDEKVRKAISNLIKWKRITSEKITKEGQHGPRVVYFVDDSCTWQPGPKPEPRKHARENPLFTAWNN